MAVVVVVVVVDVLLEEEDDGQYHHWLYYMVARKARTGEAAAGEPLDAIRRGSLFFSDSMIQRPLRRMLIVGATVQYGGDSTNEIVGQSAAIAKLFFFGVLL